jgi:hypothetical protein
VLLVYIIYGFEVVRIQERKKALETFVNQKVRLIVEDNDKVFPRDGILKDFDDTNYYVEMFHGSKRGLMIAFLRTTVRRIEPLASNGFNRGGRDNAY